MTLSWFDAAHPPNGSGTGRPR